MIIRRCQDCNEYKYLPDGKLCRSCTTNSTATSQGSTITIGQGSGITFPENHLFKTLCITGPVGTGKTTALTQIQQQLADNDNGFCYIGAHGEAKTIEKSIPSHRKSDVVWINTDPKEPTLTMNLLETYRDSSDADYSMEANARTEAVMQLLKQQNGHWGPRTARTAHYFVEESIKSNKTYTLKDLHQILDMKKDRDAFINSHDSNIPSNVKSRLLNTKKKQFNPIINRIESMIGNNTTEWLLANQNPTLDAPRIINNDKIVLVDLSTNVSSQQRQTLAYTILRQLFDELRVQDNKSDQYFISLDDCPELMPDQESILKVKGRARRHRLGLMVSAQSPQSIGKLFSSSGYVLGFKPAKSSNTKILKRELDASGRTIRNLDRYEFLTSLPIDSQNRPDHEKGKLQRP